jgi:hypothetical protein
VAARGTLEKLSAYLDYHRDARMVEDLVSRPC